MQGLQDGHLHLCPFVHGDVPIVPLCATAGEMVAAIQYVFYEGFCSITEASDESARQRRGKSSVLQGVVNSVNPDFSVMHVRGLGVDVSCL
jgi:hypothetical protein